MHIMVQTVHKPATESKDRVRGDDDNHQDSSGHIHESIPRTIVHQNVRGDTDVLAVEAEVTEHTCGCVDTEADEDRQYDYEGKGFDVLILQVRVNRNRGDMELEKRARKERT